MAFTMKVSRFEKKSLPIKSSIPLSIQPNFIEILSLGAIGKLMIQTRDPIPTYPRLNPGVYATNFPFPGLIIL